MLNKEVSTIFLQSMYMCQTCEREKSEIIIIIKIIIVNHHHHHDSKIMGGMGRGG